MQHEDRVLKSIDLLTYNARETLNKFYLWASSPDSDISFNLYDALPEYSKGGNTGSGVFIKPIKVPSFNSISSGIFGPVGTTSDRDIFWNFNFIANGNGWVFDEYVRSNNGLPVNNLTSPTLKIYTDVIFGKAGSSKKIDFINSMINYTSDKGTILVSPDSIDISTPSLTISDVNSIDGVFSLNLRKISIGTDIASYRGSNVSGFISYSENICDQLDMASKNILIRGLSTKNKTYNVVRTLDNSIEIGDGDASLTILSSEFNTKYIVNKPFNISAVNLAGNELIKILGTQSSATNKIDMSVAMSLGTYGVKNLFIGGNALNNEYLTRLSAITSEGFQLFTRSEYNDNVASDGVYEYFDAWLDAGVNPRNVVRKTSTYSSLVNGIDDPLATISSPAPYYLNLGTRGVLNIMGGVEASIGSSGTISLEIDDSPELLITKGKVTIPNLDVPSLANVSLSTLIKSSFMNFNPQVKIFGFGKLKIENTGSSITGMEISTDISNNYELIDSRQLYTWSTFNSIDGNTYYYYTLYLVNSSNSDSYKLICETSIGGVDGPDYINPVTTSTVLDNIPKNVIHPGSNVVESFNKNLISVVSSAKSVYVIYANRNLNSTDTIKIYSSSDHGTSFTLKAPTKVVNSVYAMNSHAITTEDVGCNCGLKDKVWITVETANYSDLSNTIPVILCYDEIGDTIIHNSLSTKYDDRVNTSESEINIYYTKIFTKYVPISKIVSTYDGTTYYAYLTLAITNLTGSSVVKLFKIELNGTSLVISTPKNIPFVGYSASVEYMLIPNELSLNVNGDVYVLHTIYSSYVRTLSLVLGDNYSIETPASEWNVSYIATSDLGSNGHYGNAYSITWDEASGFASAGLSGIGTFAKMSHSSDSRYNLTQIKGWASLVLESNISCFAMMRVANSSIYLYKSDNTTVGDMYDISSVIFTSASLGIFDESGSIIPLAPRYVIVDNDVTLLTRYDIGSDPSVNYSDTLTYIIETTKSNNLSYSYDTLLNDSFIDMLGASIYAEGMFATILSNKKYGKYSYRIGSYDVSGIDAKVYSNINNGVVSEIFAQSISNSVSNYFKQITLNNNTSAPLDSTNIILEKDGSTIDASDSIIPVSIFATCSVDNQTNNTLSRHGSFDSVGSSDVNGIKYWSYDLLNARNALLLPVEFASLFAKRVSQNNLDSIIRSDVSIVFQNTIPSVTIIGNASDFQLASVTWNRSANSGHMAPWLSDINYKSISFNTNMSQSITREAYVVKDPTLSKIPDNSSIYDEYVMIYDKIYNRTIVAAMPYNGQLVITSSGITSTNSCILISISNEIINPLDVAFDSTHSIKNDKGNVTSIRINNTNTLHVRNVYGNQQTESSIVLGYTRTNYIEGSC